MKSKYPILLVHGIMLKDMLFLKSFGKIPDILREDGFCVYCSTNDGVGTVENNAKQLKDQIKEILKKEQTDKINVIAHSKGGLDCKYMIQNLNMKDKVASLTTISTPHKGAQLASTILGFPKWILISISTGINLCYKILGDKKPNVLKACNQLKLVNKHKKTNIDFCNEVYCQSYSSVMKKSKDDILMAIPHIILKKYSNDESDGMVSNKSSKFGEYKGNCVKGSISHTKIVDLMTNEYEKEQIYKFYKEICNDLIKRGF